MAARARKSNESFAAYRASLIKEAEWLKWRTSPSFRTGGGVFQRFARFMHSNFQPKAHHMQSKKMPTGIRKRGIDGTNRGGIDGTKLRWPS